MLASQAQRLSSAAVIALILLPGLLAAAQETTPVSASDAYEHQLNDKPELIHANIDSAEPEPPRVAFQVVVDEHGKVISADPVDGPPQFFAQATSIELRRTFKPFTKDGQPNIATLSDEVEIVPPEEWLQPHVPFPPLKDWNTLRIHLERGNCKSCFTYSVDVRGNGDVEFNGGAGVLTPGRHHGRVSGQSVRNLFTAFQLADYFSLLDSYSYPITDSEKVVTQLSFDGQSKSVLDYIGLECGLPVIVKELELSVDRIAGTEKWIKGNAETGASLVAENWNFNTLSNENRALFTNAASARLRDLLQLYLNRSGERNPLWSCSLEGAAARGDLALANLLLQKGVNPTDPPCGVAPYNPTVLMNAAVSGNVALVREILQYHPNVNAKFNNDRSTLSFFLERSNRNADALAITRLLIAAGADVNDRDKSGRTPIFYGCYQNPEVTRLLAKAGANVNAKDNAGQTPLMSCFAPASIQALIDAGAYPKVLGPIHLTAAQQARKMGATEKARIIESATQPRGHP